MKKQKRKQVIKRRINFQNEEDQRRARGKDLSKNNFNFSSFTLEIFLFLGFLILQPYMSRYSSQ